MKCYNCGSKNEKDNKYCKYCGVFLRHVPNKIYPNCSICKWREAAGQAPLDTCRAQANVETYEVYGTPNCFGVYEPAL